MPDTEYKRSFQLAKDRALFGFAELARRMVKEADESIVLALSDSRSRQDHHTLLMADRVLQQEGAVFLKRLDARFKNYLERAIQTMYTDLRPGLANVSMSELSLIDDETMHRQIEVDRLMVRMREANEDAISRLNVIIAQMHGNREARERENPFRPYLLARSVYEAATEIVPEEEAVGKLVFQHLSTALIRNLPAYYTGVCRAFEASGLRAEFVAQPSKMMRNQRYFGGVATTPEVASVQPAPGVMAGMQQMLELLRQVPATPQQISGQLPAQGVAGAVNLQDFIRKMFSPDGTVDISAARPEKGKALPDDFAWLLEQLNRYQSLAANGQAIDDGLLPQQNQLFVLRDRLGTERTTDRERMMIHVVAMLFEFLLSDESIPASIRDQLGRLQVPVLKAALLEPEMLHAKRHPVRWLLNRMSSVGTRCDRSTFIGRGIAKEIEETVGRILADFETDTAIFSDAHNGFERRLETLLCGPDAPSALCAKVLEEAEKAAVMVPRASAMLVELLASLTVDRRIVDFITQIWARVLVHALLRENAANAASTRPLLSYQNCRDVLADLIWSVQEKQTPQERSILVRLLPDLVKRLRSGMQLIRLPEPQSKRALDQLVELHTHVLRFSQSNQQQLPTLEELRRHFSPMSIESAHGGLERSPIETSPDLISALLADQNVTATLHLDSGFPSQHGDEDDAAGFVAELQAGFCMAYRAEGSMGESTVRLAWISPLRSFLVFAADQGGPLLVYASASLLKALDGGLMRPLESAPLFDRATGAMLAGAQSLQPQ